MIIFDEDFKAIREAEMVSDALREGRIPVMETRICHCCQKEMTEWMTPGSGYVVCEKCEDDRYYSLHSQLDNAPISQFKRIREAHRPKVYYLEKITIRDKLDIKPSETRLRNVI